jgi:TRAP-type C4-dicarboxylate transport system substrate-binding protein
MNVISAKSALIVGGLVAAVGAVALFAGSPQGTAATAAVGPRTVKWYVVHARDYEEYDDQLMAFGKQLGERTGGKLQVEFAHSEIGSGWRDRSAEKDGYARVANGESDVSQLGVDTLGAEVILYPQVFRNYDHAEAVWRGPVGQKLLDGISQRSEGKLEALAFSYSGGFRALVGSRAVQSVDDVKGAKIVVNGRGLSPDEELMIEMGAVPSVEANHDYPVDKDRVAATTKRVSAQLASGALDLFSVEINGLAYAQQSGPLDFKPLHVNVLNQSMYATSIVANAKFLASLDPELRAVFVEETRKFAVAERQLSAELAIRNLETFATKYGHKVVAFPPEARAKLLEAGKAVQRKHSQWAEVIKEIEATGEVPLLAAAGMADALPGVK